MKTNMINVSVEFVIDALQARYDDVKELWGCDASASLWDQALQLVEECGMGENVTSPSIFVDNYLVNGDFVSRKDLKDCEYIDVVITCDDELGDYISDEDWDKYCQDNALIYNSEYACIQF